MLVVAIVVMVSLLASQLIHLRSPWTSVPQPTSTPVPTLQWSDPIELGVGLSNDISITDDIVAFMVGDSVKAVDLAKRQVLWTATGIDPEGYSALGDASGVVLATKPRRVVDPLTGATIAQLPDDPGGNARPMWAGNGMILMRIKPTSADAPSTFCVLKMTDPASCVWQAPGLKDLSWVVHPVSGKWMNTAHGMVDLFTGEPAPFGADAGTVTADGLTVYYGNTPGLPSGSVYRMTQSESADGFTQQLWDTEHDAALTPEVHSPQIVLAPADSPYYVVSQAGYQSPTTYTGFSRTSSQQVWQLPQSNAYIVSPLGDSLLMRTPSEGNSNDIWLMDMSTGNAQWNITSSPPADWKLVGDVLIRGPLDFRQSAYDPATGRQLWSVLQPVEGSVVSNDGPHFYTTTSEGMKWVDAQLWILNT